VENIYKAIFLDVDAVLNSARFCESKGLVADRQCVKYLKQIIERTNALVVMSSGWRLWFDDDMQPEQGEALQLYNILIENDIELYDKTPDFSTEEIRTKRTFSHVKAKEILAWLEQNKDIEQYVVLDDLELKNEEINAHLVQTNAEIGLTQMDVERAVEMLN
jgi:hypothetical protein